MYTDVERTWTHKLQVLKFGLIPLGKLGKHISPAQNDGLNSTNAGFYKDGFGMK